jgi:hypothetical protein
MRPNRVLSTLALASLLTIVLAGVAPAADDEISQYLTKKSSDSSSSKYANPGPFEMFVLGIVFDTDGTFGNCDGFVLPPRSTYRTTDLDYGGVVEAISVPTDSGARGEFRKSAGVWGKDHKEQMHARDPRHYELPSDPDIRQDVIDCACSEIADETQPRNILQKFHIKCPKSA